MKKNQETSLFKRTYHLVPKSLLLLMICLITFSANVSAKVQLSRIELRDLNSNLTNILDEIKEFPFFTTGKNKILYPNFKNPNSIFFIKYRFLFKCNEKKS